MSLLDQLAMDVAAHTPLPITTERDLQKRVAEVVAGRYEVTREFRLPGRAGVIDHAVRSGDTLMGIECKLQTGRPALLRQLRRYAETGLFDGLLVITQTSISPGDSIEGVPIAVLRPTGRAGL